MSSEATKISLPFLISKMPHYPNSCISGRPHAIIPSWIVVNLLWKLCLGTDIKRFKGPAGFLSSIWICRAQFVITLGLHISAAFFISTPNQLLIDNES